MKNQAKMSDKTQEVLVLLAMTVGLAVFGILAQSLSNYMEGGIFTHYIIRYWIRVLLVSGGLAWAWKTLNSLSHRNPYLYRRIQFVVLLVLLIFNIYVAIVEVLSYFAYNWVEFRSQEVYIYALQMSKLVGRAENMETILPELFWRWEKNAVLPALGLGYGYLAALVYVWICFMWMCLSIRCIRYLHGEERLDLCSGGEKLLGVDLATIVYLFALLSLVPKLIGQITPLFDLTIFYGGVLFSSQRAEYLSLDLKEAGILQLLTMAYLLYPPQTVVPEKNHSLPADEEAEPVEEPLPESVMETVIFEIVEEANIPETAEADRS